MNASQIFFSYAREDKERVALLVATLETYGWSVFWDRRIPAGQTWRGYIGEALDQARCVVVTWSESSIGSEWVIEEADEGRERGILVPILLDPVRPPRGFRGIQAADLTDWSPERSSPAFESFLADVGAVLGRSLSHTAQFASPTRAFHDSKERDNPQPDAGVALTVEDGAESQDTAGDVDDAPLIAAPPPTEAARAATIEEPSLAKKWEQLRTDTEVSPGSPHLSGIAYCFPGDTTPTKQAWSRDFGPMSRSDKSRLGLALLVCIALIGAYAYWAFRSSAESPNSQGTTRVADLPTSPEPMQADVQTDLSPQSLANSLETSGPLALQFIGNVDPIRRFNSTQKYCCSNIAISVDKELIAGVGGDSPHSMANIVEIWDVKSGNLMRTIDAHSENIYPLVFSSDGSQLLTGSYDGTGKLWSLKNGSRIRTFNNVRFVEDGAFIPQNSSVALLNRDGELRIWDTTDKNAKPKYIDFPYLGSVTPDGSSLGYSDWLCCIALASDGKSLITAGATLGRVDLTTNKYKSITRLPLDSSHRLVALSNNRVIVSGSKLVMIAGSSTRSILTRAVLLDTMTGETLWTVTSNGAAISAFSPYLIVEKDMRIYLRFQLNNGMLTGKYENLVTGQAINDNYGGSAESGGLFATSNGRGVILWPSQSISK